MEEVKRAFERCQRRYPTIQLPLEDFAAHVQGVVAALPGVPAAETPDSRAWLSSFALLHHEDLFLAFACSRGDRIAWEYFADDYLPVLQRYAVQACRNLHESEDLAQELVARLMEGGEKLAGFNGRASLAGWLRVAVSHAAIDRFRRERRRVPLDEMDEARREASCGAARQSGENPAERLDARWGAVLSQVLADEIRRLPARDRLLLGLYYLEEVPLKTIGRQFGVHEATASRWLEGLRREIRRRIERELRNRHGLRPKEIRSLWHWVSENEGLSLQRVLRE